MRVVKVSSSICQQAIFFTGIAIFYLVIKVCHSHENIWFKFNFVIVNSRAKWRDIAKREPVFPFQQ